MAKASVAATAQFIQRSIQKTLRELPALPDAVLRVVEETNKPEPSASQIERYVSSDQALASKVLRVVNSAYYGLSGQVTSLGQSIMILGMQQVRNLVLSVGAITMFEVKGARQQDMLKRFWLHAFATALGAQIIGRSKNIDRNSQEIVFVGGLLHDIGRLFLFANFTAAYDQLIKRALASSISVEMAEWSLLGIGHAEVGQMMAEQWRLPQQLIDVIAEHEGPLDGTEDATVMCVHIADALAKFHYYAGSTIPALAIDPLAMEWLGLSDEEFQALCEEVHDKTSEAVALFQQMAA